MGIKSFAIQLVISFMLVFISVFASSQAVNDHTSKIVNLGYARHRPTYTNTTTSGVTVLSYMNVRFAQPPIGPLRFKKPVMPPPYSDGIQNGSYPPLFTDCISSAPPVVPFPGINGTTWGHEDCLFLNVLVPEGVNPGDDVPVLHWIVGSAYAFGSKDSFIDPLGLFDGIKNNPKEKFIYVASNYRLGIPGWAASPKSDMDPNVGLHDAIAALKWTRLYIARFGGNPKKITVMGQSAGGGLINLMITGNGGNGDSPFQQAVISSPAITPRRNVSARRQYLYEEVLKATNCTSITCLRSISEHTLMAANDYLINRVQSTGGGGNFGPGIGFSPVVDDDYVTDLPVLLLGQGKFQRGIKSVIVGNMANEGLGTSSDTNMPQAFPNLVRKVLPTASNATIASIQGHFPFPPDLPEKLAWDWTTAIIFECNAYSLVRALKNKARRYIMSIPPATHGQDIFYLLYFNETVTPVTNTTTALRFQSYLRQFIAGNHIESQRSDSCDTGPTLLPDWPFFGDQSIFFNVTLKGFEEQQVPRDMETTCQFLNQVLADPENGA